MNRKLIMMIMIIIILLLFSQSLEGCIPVSHEISLDHGNKTVEFLVWLFLPLNLCLFGQRNCWTDGIGVTMYCFDIYSYNNDCDLIDQIHCKSIKCIVVDRCDALLWVWGLYINLLKRRNVITVLLISPVND